MKTYIVTGATGGLGRFIAKNLSKEPETKIILAVRDTDKGRHVADQLGKNTEVLELDLSSFEGINAFISSWKDDLTGLINNAGVQIVDKTRFIKNQRFEETFAVNHLAALKLTVGLLPFINGGRILFIGSGTHHPDYKVATMFGFRGARFNSIKACAEGLAESGPIRQIGLDRYATSKFLNTVTTVELARRIPVEKVSFFCLDPGLMPGTGLARTAPAHMQFIWANILPAMAKLMPGTSTPKRSGKTAAWIMTSGQLSKSSGLIFSYHRKPSKVVWEKVFDPEIGKAVVDDSLQLLNGNSENPPQVL